MLLDEVAIDKFTLSSVNACAIGKDVFLSNQFKLFSWSFAYV